MGPCIAWRFRGNGPPRAAAPTRWPIDRRAVPEEGGHVPPTTRLAAAERAAGPFVIGQTPAQPNCAREVIPAPPFIQARPRPVPPGETGRRRRRPLRAVLSVERQYTSFSLLDRARPVFSFSSGKKKRKWGVQRTSHLHGCIPPPPARASISPPFGGTPPPNRSKKVEDHLI